MSENSPPLDAPDLAGTWSRRRFLAAAAAAPLALWLPLPPGTIPRIVRAHGGAGTTYYVSPHGDDANGGTSPLEAWRTIARVNEARFGPGDTVLFEGGQTYAGMLHITDSGTAAAPITFGSYGRERATLARTDDDHGIYLENASHITLENLNVDGRDRMARSRDGVWVAVRDSLRRGYTLRNLNIYRWGHNGLRVSAHASAEGDAGRIEDVLIENVQVYHCRGDVGLSVWGERGDYESIRNVTVRGCTVTDVIGTGWGWSGSGIILFWTTDFLVEHCEVSYCGLGSGSAGSGPVGIWTAAVDRGVIQYCESHHNTMEAGSGDGGGFDLDGGTRNVTLQYCYSHDNRGYGYMLCSFGRHITESNVIRYCISQNDNREGNAGGYGLQVWRGREAAQSAESVRNCQVYGNTFVTTTSPPHRNAALVWAPRRVTNITVRNNIFRSANHVLLTHLPSSAGIILQGNNWYATGNWQARQGGTTYPSLEALRADASQERFEETEVGTDVDPLLHDPGNGGTVGLANLPKLAAHLPHYRLQAGSVMPTAGVDLRALGIDPGERDFFGAEIPSEGPFRAVGAASTTTAAEDEMEAALHIEEPRGRLERFLDKVY